MIYEDETFKIIGAAMHVHGVLGIGFLEAVYQEALAIEFTKNGIPFKKEVPLAIDYEGIKLEKHYTADFVCYDKIIVELKAVDKLADTHYAQTANYLKATGYKVGLLITFGARRLQHRRIAN